MTQHRLKSGGENANKDVNWIFFATLFCVFRFATFLYKSTSQKNALLHGRYFS
jgi:hypothetical protein